MCKYSPYREGGKLQSVLAVSLSASKYSKMPLLTDSGSLAPTFFSYQKPGLFKFCSHCLRRTRKSSSLTYSLLPVSEENALYAGERRGHTAPWLTSKCPEVISDNRSEPQGRFLLRFGSGPGRVSSDAGVPLLQSHWKIYF